MSTGLTFGDPQVDQPPPAFMVQNGEAGLGKVIDPGMSRQKTDSAWPKCQEIPPVTTMLGDQKPPIGLEDAGKFGEERLTQKITSAQWWGSGKPVAWPSLR